MKDNKIKNYEVDILTKLLQKKQLALKSSRRMKKDNFLYSYQVVLLAGVIFQIKRWSR